MTLALETIKWAPMKCVRNVCEIQGSRYLLGQRFRECFVFKFVLQRGEGEKTEGVQISKTKHTEPFTSFINNFTPVNHIWVCFKGCGNDRFRDANESHNDTCREWMRNSASCINRGALLCTHSLNVQLQLPLMSPQWEFLQPFQQG